MIEIQIPKVPSLANRVIILMNFQAVSLSYKLIGLRSLMNSNQEKGDFEIFIERTNELVTNKDHKLMKFGTQVENQYLSFPFELLKQK